MEREPSIVELVDIEFENSPTRINFLRDFPETRIADRVLGPYRIGQELELPLWIAHYIVQTGYAKFREEEQFNLKNLSSIHFRETLAGPRPISRLPNDFYFRLRRFLKELRVQEAKDRSKGRDLDKALNLSSDIVSIRVKQIASLGASGELSPDLMSNLTIEERTLLDAVRKSVDLWKQDILGRETGS